MSKRKDIQTLHALTGLKYSYIRKRYKTNHYDYWKTFYEIQGDLAYHFEKTSLFLSEHLAIALNELSGTVKDFSKSMEEFRRSLTKGETNK